MRISPLLVVGGCASMAVAANLDARIANCSSLELIIARGTSEPLNPSFGIIVGDPLFNTVKALVPDVTGYSVKYPASLDCNSRTIGAQDTVNHITNQSEACTSQQYILVGYSQGADVMHFAAQSIPTKLFSRVVGLVMYGDPGNRGIGAIDPLGGSSPPFVPELANKLKENCAFDDPVCNNNGTVIAAHLSYNDVGTKYMLDSAAYIQKQLQTSGKAGAQAAPFGPGNQTEGNTAALVALGAALGGKGVQVTCNSTTTATSSSKATMSASATNSALKSTSTSEAVKVSSTFAWFPMLFAIFLSLCL